MQDAVRIAVLVDTSTGWGRRVVHGVGNYAFKQRGWQITVEPRGVNERSGIPEGWSGHGIIARITDSRLHRELQAFDKPAVNVSGIELPRLDFPRVTSDHMVTASLAVQHFLGRGFRHLAYVAMEHAKHVVRHRDAFVNAATVAGLTCDVFDPPALALKRSWIERRRSLTHWLSGLPKPIGVFTWGSEHGRSVLNACLDCGLVVPEQVAVLGGDDDDLLCEICTPPLSAIVTPAEQIGYEAARMLHALIEGRPIPETDELLKADEVHCRQSTDTLAIADATLCKAVRYIRENIHSPSLQVSVLAELTGLSRRVLERRFQKVFGYGPAHEIQTTRNQLVRRLLRETDMSVSDIAAASGYASLEYMIRAFKKETGKTPFKYRSWIRAK